jgi:hypothetical protein
MGREGKRCMVQGLARSPSKGDGGKLGAKSTESETVPKQPTGRPSTAQTATVEL